MEDFSDIPQEALDLLFDDMPGTLRNKRGPSVEQADEPVSAIDADLFYDPEDAELDDYIANDIGEGFDFGEMMDALPEAFKGIYEEIKQGVAAIPNAKLHQIPGTALEGLIRAGTDTGDLLMRVASGVSTMAFKSMPGDAATQYHQLPDAIKSFARGYWRQMRTVEQHRAKQMMKDANYNFLPSGMVNMDLAETAGMIVDPVAISSFGLGKAGRIALQEGLKKGGRNALSRGLANTVIKTGEAQDALYGALGTVAKSPVTAAQYAVGETLNFAGEVVEGVKSRMPKKVSGERVDVKLPQEGQIGWIRKGLEYGTTKSYDAMELASQIKAHNKTASVPTVLDRIARDTTVRTGARDMANVLSVAAGRPAVRGLLVPGYKAGKAVAEGATTGGVLGLLSYDDEFAAGSLAGGAMFGPVGKLSDSIIYSKHKKGLEIDNFVEDFKSKLHPDDVEAFESYTKGSKEDEKFFAGLSYLFKNGHFTPGQGNLDIRFLNNEDFVQYGEYRGESFSEIAGVNLVNSGGRNTVVINTGKPDLVRSALPHELGHAITKMPEVQEALQNQDNLLFGRRGIKNVNGKDVLTFDDSGILSKEWINKYFDHYVESLPKTKQAKYRTMSDEQKFMIARDEIHADSIASFFQKFDPETIIRGGKIDKLKFRIGGSYELNNYQGLGGSLARGLIDNFLMARNSLGLYAVRNAGKALGLVKEGEALKLKDGRVFSNIADMLQQRRDSISLTSDPLADAFGTKWNVADLNRKDRRDITRSFLPTMDVERGDDGQPVERNGRVRFLNRTERKKLDSDRAQNLTEATQKSVTDSESISKLQKFQELENGSYRGDYIGRLTIEALRETDPRVITPHLLENIIRLNERMKLRPDKSGFLIEYTYNQVQESGKRTPDIITSNRQLIPLVFAMSKTGKNFNITGIDINDLVSRLDLFESAPIKDKKGRKIPLQERQERSKVMDIWRDEYNRIPANKKSKDASGSIRNLLMQDLWLYLKGLSEGKSGVEALGGGRNKKELARVKRKRDGLMRFLGFEKNDQMLTNANMFEQILDKNRIIKSFRLDRMQNLEISDHPATITDRAFKRVQTNTLPANRASFMGEKSGAAPDPAANVNKKVAKNEGIWNNDNNAKTKETENKTDFGWDSLSRELDRGGRLSASEEIVSIPGLPKRGKNAERWIEKPSDEGSALREMDRQESIITDWAKKNNWYIDPKYVDKLASESDVQTYGKEHSVYIQGKHVVKATRYQMYGKSHKTPSQYIDQINDYNSVVSPDMQKKFIGISEGETGVPVILTSQPVAVGDPPKNEKQIARLMKKKGYKPHNNSYYIYKNDQGVEIHDAHEGNMVVDANGDAQIFDAWIVLPESQYLTSSKRSVLDIFDTPEKVLKELGTEKPLLREVADYLSRRSQAEGKLDELTPENAKALGDVLFEEAAEALRRDQDAIGWYDRTMDEALEYLYKLHPEMKTDAGLDGLFKAVLAITSNGQDVPANFKRAEFLYKKYQETGKIISDGNWGGKNKDSINKGLKAFEEMTQQLGLEKTKDFLTREISIRDLDKVLKEYGLKPTTGELKEHTVIGAMVFGPKIGSFYGNLNKIFNSVTMDRWFMRTINRIRGTLTDPSAGAVASTGGRLLKEMKGKVSVALQKEIERIISDVGSAEFSISNYPKAKKYLKDTYKAVEKRKFKDRTKLEMPAQRLHLYLNSLNESPANGSERAWIRGAVEHAQSRLKAEKQIDISNADMQAVLWYWEKDLYQNLNVGNKTGARADYAGAARQLLEQE